MAKKATGKGGSEARGKAKKRASSSTTRAPSSGRRSNEQERFDASEAFVRLLQSPLVAELVAVAATAALASLAEHGFTSSNASPGKRAGNAVKQAGKAAAAAVGRRLGTEIDEIRKAATKDGAKA
jgi:hypothetical protein